MKSSAHPFGRLLSLLVVGIATTTAACAAPTESPDDKGSPVGDEPEVVAARNACSRESYDKAFVSYKAAVDHAKSRNAGNVCDDGTYLSDIARDLQSAVTTCGDFRSVIATSKWAAPVRDALKGNLSLAVLDGRLSVKDARGKTAFTGLAAALPGTTVFGPAPGVYGNMSKIEFGANGAATIARLEVDDKGGASWKEVRGSYKIGAVSGDTIDITIIEAGRSTVFGMKLDTAYEGVPAFHLVPKTAGATEDFRSMPSECEA